MKKSGFKLLRADPSEAKALTEIAFRSKSHWPYDSVYLEQCRIATQVTADDIRAWPFTVVLENERLCGFSGISEIKGERMLDHLWVDPPFIGRGLGRQLFQKSVDEAKALGWMRFTIASDPYAAAFYKKLGAVRIGERESTVKKGFFLPLLEFILPSAHEA